MDIALFAPTRSVGSGPKKVANCFQFRIEIQTYEVKLPHENLGHVRELLLAWQEELHGKPANK